MTEDSITVTAPVTTSEQIIRDNPDLSGTYVEGVSAVAVSSDAVKILFFDKMPSMHGPPVSKPVSMLILSKRNFVAVARLLRDLAESEQFQDVKALPIKFEAGPDA